MAPSIIGPSSDSSSEGGAEFDGLSLGDPGSNGEPASWFSELLTWIGAPSGLLELDTLDAMSAKGQISNSVWDVPVGAAGMLCRCQTGVILEAEEISSVLADN